MRNKPSIDAIGMEDMAALGEKTKGFILLEFAQANGALERPLPDLEILHLGVGEGWKSLQNLRIQPPLRDPTARAAAEGTAGVGSVSAAALANVNGEEAKEKEGGDEDDDDDRHGRVEARGEAIEGS